MKRAQTSLEIIIILGVLLLVFAGILLSSQVAINGVSVGAHNDQVTYGLDRVAQSAQEVYAQGVGAKKRVFIELPKSVATSSVDNRTLQIGLYVQEGGVQSIYRVTDMTMNGSLPSSPGGYWVNVEVFDTYVNVSY